MLSPDDSLDLELAVIADAGPLPPPYYDVTIGIFGVVDCPLCGETVQTATHENVLVAVTPGMTRPGGRQHIRSLAGAAVRFEPCGHAYDPAADEWIEG